MTQHDTKENHKKNADFDDTTENVLFFTLILMTQQKMCCCFLTLILTTKHDKTDFFSNPDFHDTT